MDILSHGLWGSLAFGRQTRRQFWQSFFFGVAPDLFSFGIFFVAALFGFAVFPHFNNGVEPPTTAMIPAYVGQLYNITHSLIIFAIAFIVVWSIHGKPFLPMSAWGLHILFDIGTHSYAFFPTPFLWPVSHFEVNGISWSEPIILIPDIVLLITLYLWFFVYKKNRSAV